MGPYTLGHTRLAIQDLTGASHQPYLVGDIAVTYNGELWEPHPGLGDTPVVAHLLSLHGVAALPMLHGMFALAWSDGEHLWLARDTYGEVPLHWGWTAEQRIVYGSEIKALLAHGALPHTITWVEPGTWVRFGGPPTRVRWAPPVLANQHPPGDLADLLTTGSVDRMTADVPVAVLASGGLDSSAILALLVDHGYRPTCYTAVYAPHTADLDYARKVSAHLGLDLVEVTVPDPTKDTIDDAIRATEMTFKAQIEIALGCLPLAQAIASDGFKVVLSGEGSDELLGSYGWGYHGVQRQGWFGYRHDQFTRQHKKNFARTNKVFMAHGVEPRLPFLHDPYVRTVLGMDQDTITGQGRHPKAVLAASVQHLLPDGMPWRLKHAFQTGAKIDRATSKLIDDPTRYYHAEHLRIFGKVKP